MHKKKITFKLLIREILDIVEFKRGTPRTFLKMITKPSLVVDSFLMLSHRKNGFVGPFRILFIIATMCVFINESLKSDIDYRSMPLPKIQNNNIYGSSENFVYGKYIDMESFYKKGGDYSQKTFDELLLEYYIETKDVKDDSAEWAVREFHNRRELFEKNLYEENIPIKAREDYIELLELMDSMQLTINPFYYALPIAVIISCFTMLLFFHVKKSFIEHFIINLYPIGIIFMCYGFTNATDHAYGWLGDFWNSSDFWFSFNLRDKISISLFSLERLYVAFYYINIFGRNTPIYLNENAQIWKASIVSACVLFYPTFDIVSWRGLGSITNSVVELLGFNIYKVSVFSWVNLIDYLNLNIYYKIAFWYIS